MKYAWNIYQLNKAILRQVYFLIYKEECIN